MKANVDVQPGYAGLAEAFRTEGCDTYFVLLGTSNMHWSAVLSGYDGVRAFHVRHEHCAVAMAMGYAVASGKVGVASVTCGPGFTQIVTALTGAVQSRTPLIVFAGEPPLTRAWDNQRVDQAALTNATGAHYIAIHAISRMYEQVREAFHMARAQRRPVVLAMPSDLQREAIPPGLRPLPSADVLPQPLPSPPNPASVRFLVDKLCGAKVPIMIAGRGAVAANAEIAIEALADRSGALLATTLPARGLFDHNRYALGIAGGFAREAAREVFLKADLVVTFGASLTSFTTDGGDLFPGAYVIQVDTDPKGLYHGRKAADYYVRADAKLTAEAVLEGLASTGATAASIRTEALAKRLRDFPAHPTQFAIPDGTIDPRDLISVLDDVVPKDWAIVSGAGHQGYFHTQMRHRSPRDYHVIREFGAIGNGLSFAVGVAAARGDGRVIVFDGDGGIMMNIQELDTIARHKLRLIICCLNDGGFGSEFHRLAAEGIDETGSRHGRTDIAKIARGFGIRGRTITSTAELAAVFAEFKQQEQSELWNVQIADTVISPETLRELKKAGH